MTRTSEMIQSNYLKKEDVGEDGTIVTVRSFERVNVAQKGEAPDEKWTMQFDEFEKPMVLNSTNIKLAEKALGSDETDDWIGKKLIVYNDPNVSFGKELVGGIRIKAYRKAAPPRELPTKQRQSEADDDARFGDDDAGRFGNAR
jgi:hypothetical protein